MSASDHINPQQFSTWYHGTTSEAAASIKREGLRSDVMGDGRMYATMASHADEALIPGSRYSALVELHVPDSKASEYLNMGEGVTDPHKSLGFMGTPRLSGIRKPLPPDMVHKVTELG